MKRIILMRHAEAEGENIEGDFYRRLTKGGEEQARAAANFLSSFEIDKVIVSPSNRTKQTLNIVLNKLNIKTIEECAQLYERDQDYIIGLIQAQPQDINCLLIIGHNPSIYAIALELIENDAALINFNMSPASVISLTFPNLNSLAALQRNRGLLETTFCNS